MCGFFERLRGAKMKETKKVIPHVSKEYYDISAISKCHAIYNMIIGQRSNGKTYAALKMALEHYLKTGEPSAYIRRLDEQIKPSNLDRLFSPFDIFEMTDQKYNGVRYWQRKFTLVFYDENGKVIKRDKAPFMFACSISTADTTKGQDRGFVKYIIFDEFLTRNFYLQNEYILFQNLLSSLIRDRSGTVIYMLANTVNKSSIYFEEFGIHDISKVKQGTIEVYEYGKNSKLKLALEYCSESKIKKEVSKYFAFDNPRLKMITSGAWEIDNYPHAPSGLNAINPILIFYVDCRGLGAKAPYIQGNLYCKNSNPFIFFHYLTKEIKDPEHRIIYSPEIDSNILHQNTFDMAVIPAMKNINACITTNKIFYATNEVGEVLRNFKLTSKKRLAQM